MFVRFHRQPRGEARLFCAQVIPQHLWACTTVRSVRDGDPVCRLGRHSSSARSICRRHRVDSGHDLFPHSATQSSKIGQAFARA